MRSGTAATRPRVRTVGKVRNLFECRCCCCCDCFPSTSPADQSWWSLFSEPISASKDEEEEEDLENPCLISDEEEEEVKPELEEEEEEEERHLWWWNEEKPRRDFGEERLLSCAEGAQVRGRGGGKVLTLPFL